MKRVLLFALLVSATTIAIGQVAQEHPGFSRLPKVYDLHEVVTGMSLDLKNPRFLFLYTGVVPVDGTAFNFVGSIGIGDPLSRQVDMGFLRVALGMSFAVPDKNLSLAIQGGGQHTIGADQVRLGWMARLHWGDDETRWDLLIRVEDFTQTGVSFDDSYAVMRPINPIGIGIFAKTHYPGEFAWGPGILINVMPHGYAQIFTWVPSRRIFREKEDAGMVMGFGMILRVFTPH